MENQLFKVVLWDLMNRDYVFVPILEYYKEYYPIEDYTPIGIEIMNNQITDDDTSRVLSLVNMSLDNPEKGTIRNETMKFGIDNTNVKGMPTKIHIPTVEENGAFFKWFDIFEGENLFFHSDIFPKAYSNLSMRPNAYTVPSPFTKDNLQNYMFSQSFEFGSILEDMNGKEWTEKILETIAVNGNDGKWKEDFSVIENISNNHNAPSVESTWRFSPNGKEYGLWYIPSVCEWCYVLDKLYEVNLTLKLLIERQPLLEDKIALIENRDYWTSSLVNEEYASVIDVGCGRFLMMNKYQDCITRAMIKI